MKKILFLITSILITNFVTSQEEVEEKAFRVGLKTGLNVSMATVKREFDNSTSPRIAYYGGLFANIRLVKKLYLQPEVYYSVQGFKEEFSNGYIKQENEVKTSYINIPVVFQYYTMKDLYVETGGQIGLMLTAKGEADYYNAFYNYNFSENNVDLKKTKEVNTHMVSYLIGAGYKFDRNLSVNMRYNIGITQVDTSSEVSIKNNVLQIGIAYTF